MNNRQVFIVTPDDEIYLGTVGDIIGVNTLSDFEGGPGMSLAAAISDLISIFISTSITETVENWSGIITGTFTIELREPRGS